MSYNKSGAIAALTFVLKSLSDGHPARHSDSRDDNPRLEKSQFHPRKKRTIPERRRRSEGQLKTLKTSSSLSRKQTGVGEAESTASISLFSI